MRLDFRILNVFTVDDDRLSGNPLCVFEDARELSTAQMQALARQLNLSETTFVLPSERATARMRIFTPTFEMPFAGHPTLGTAHVVHTLRARAEGQRRDEIVLELEAGLVPVTRSHNSWTLRAAKSPATRPATATRVELARMLGLPDDAINGEPLWVNTGVEQLVIPLASAELVRAAQPVPALIEQHGYSETRTEAMAYVWAPDDATGEHLLVRFFFTQHAAIIEDPATGSACANLGGWFIATNRSPPFAATLSQGAAVGRPSRLGLRVDADRNIFVSGTVVELGRGSLDV